MSFFGLFCLPPELLLVLEEVLTRFTSMAGVPATVQHSH